MNKLIALMVSVVMAGTTFAGATTHFALDTRSGMRLVPAGSTLAVYYSPDFSSVKDVEIVRVLTNGAVWVESAVRGSKDFTFGDTGIYQFTHQVLTNGVVAGEMSASYAVAEAGRVDIPSGWTEIPDCLFKNCNWLTSVTIPASVTNVAPTAFAGCSNIVGVEFGAWPNMLHQCEPETSGWLAVGEDVYQTDRQNQYDQTLVLKTEVEGPRRTSFRWKATYSGNYLRY